MNHPRHLILCQFRCCLSRRRALTSAQRWAYVITVLAVTGVALIIHGLRNL